MKIAAAAIQMASEVGAVARNVDHADALLAQAHGSGAVVAVLPEMFNTGYGLIPDYSPLAETRGGPTLRHLSARCRQWGMMVAAGFVERDGHHLYDALALALPDGSVHVYRKRHLVFWEPFRFRRGREAPVVATPWGRVGMAICADMIHRRVWDEYRDRVDLALIGSAWPDFACRETGRKHWLFGRVGPHAGVIPGRAAADLGIPVVFANQTGPTRTVIPFLGTRIVESIADRFAGQSCVCDGRHAAAVMVESGEGVAIAEVTIHPPRGPRSWHIMSPSDSEASSSGSATSGSISRAAGPIAAPAAVA